MANKINKITKNGVAYDIEDPNAATKTELSAETSARQNADGDLQTAINGKQAALSADQMKAVNSGIDSTKVGQIATNTTNIASNSGEIATINGKIPAQASSSNQLADKSFVNSTVQTASANFRGNWATWSDVPTDANDYPADADGNKTPTKNDYMVVQDASDYPTSPDPALEGTWRFKYTGTWATDGKDGWYLEYQVNETPLTSDQLAALNSGITAEAVTKLGGIEAGAEVNDINSISVNGTAVTPDANKNVALTIPDGIKTLTTADYNWSQSGQEPYTAINVTNLPAGIYKTGESIVWHTSGATQNLGENEVLIIGGLNNSNKEYIYTQTGYVHWKKDTDDASERNILRGAEIVRNLTSTNDYAPLSAKQGKVLKDLVDAKADKTAFTGTDGTSAGVMGLVPAPATTDAGKFLKADGSWGEAGGGVKTLTTADYNYPTTGTKTGIALWLLDPGFYKVDNSSGASVLSLFYTNSKAAIDIPSGDVGGVIVNRGTSIDYAFGLVFGEASPTGFASSPGAWYFRCSSNGGAGGKGLVIDENNVKNVLTNTATTLPLSANMGKYLNDNKADKTAFTGTDGTSAGVMGLVPAPATTDAGKVLSASGAWTGLPDGIKTLTTDDYNWHYSGSTDDGVALWKVTPGFYKVPYGVKTYVNNAGGVITQREGMAVFVMVSDDKAGYKQIIGSSAGNTSFGFRLFQVFVNPSNGTPVDVVSLGLNSHALLNVDDVANALTVNSSQNPLSAKQGKVLNDKIGGSLSNLTTTDKTSLIAAINEVASRLINGGTTAPTASTKGAVGTQYTYVDTTGTPTAHLCVCTEIDNTDPSNPVYTWSTLI